MTKELKARSEETDFDLEEKIEAQPQQPSKEITALHHAAMKNEVKLLDGDVKPQQLLQEDPWGNTPLMWAIANSSVAFVCKVLEKNCPEQVKLKSSHCNGNTPLILAASKGWKHKGTHGPQDIIIRNLLEADTDINAQDVFGRTALHYACLHRDTDLIGLLREKGAIWDVQDKQGHTPFELFFLDKEMQKKLLLIATGDMKAGYAMTYVPYSLIMPISHTGIEACRISYFVN